MAAGLALTGITSLWMASDPNRMVSFVQGGTMWMLFIAEIVLVFYLSARILSMKPLTATICFAGYSILNGLTLSVIFYAYTLESITSTFFITAATFGGMALYAATTKRNLATMGNYLGMAYDTQYILSISRNYSGSLDESDYIRFSIIGALKLYLDFINMFLYMLRFVGRRK